MVKTTILVVDEQELSRELSTAALAGAAGYRIETATTAAAAIARLDRGGIDLLLSSATLPAADAAALLRHARDCSPFPEIILAVDAASVDTAVTTLPDGIRDILVRPFHPEQLRQSVRSSLVQRRLRQENAGLHDRLRLHQQGQQLATLLDVEELLPAALAALHHETATGLRQLAFVANRDGIAQVVTGGAFEDAQARALAEALAPQLDDAGYGQLLDADCLQMDTADGDYRRLWLFPLAGDQNTRGALVLVNAAGQEFPEPFPAEALQFLGTQAAIGLRNACRFQGARELIYTDDLTRLYNHRYLQIALDLEIRRAQRYDLQFSVAFIDLDRFKLVNDTHGHLVGSDVLREVGTILRRCVREIDLLFRYGGDEFTALLVGTDCNGARIVAERIRRAIEAHEFRAGAGRACRLTATVGYATYPTHTTSKQKLIDLADQAMYQGKHTRNAVRCAELDLLR